MPNALLVDDEHPLKLEGAVDSASALQLTHGSDSLSQYNQTLHSHHANLNVSSGTIQLQLFDFSYGGANWQVKASHQAGTSISWSRSTEYAYCDFAAMTDLLEVDVVATSDASPPTTKTRRIWIKTMPTDNQPDRP